jgi:hypothetical protein
VFVVVVVVFVVVVVVVAVVVVVVAVVVVVVVGSDPLVSVEAMVVDDSVETRPSVQGGSSVDTPPVVSVVLVPESLLSPAESSGDCDIRWAGRDDSPSAAPVSSSAV